MSAIQENNLKINFKEGFNLYYRIYNAHMLHTAMPLVCVHSISGNCSDFEYLGRAIDDFCVITPDIVGRGRSDWLSDTELYNYDTYCACITQLLDRLTISQVNFVGTSMGGILGMHLASRYNNLINKLVLNDIGPYMGKRPLLGVCQFLLRRPVFREMREAEAFIRDSLRNFGIEEKEHWDHLVKHYVAPCAGGHTLAFDPKIGAALQHDIAKANSVMDLWSLWAKIQCSVLVLRGEHSNVLTSDILKRMLSSKAGVTAYTIQNAGHAPALFTADRIYSIVRWLDESNTQS